MIKIKFPDLGEVILIDLFLIEPETAIISYKDIKYDALITLEFNFKTGEVKP